MDSFPREMNGANQNIQKFMAAIINGVLVELRRNLEPIIPENMPPPLQPSDLKLKLNETFLLYNPNTHEKTKATFVRTEQLDVEEDEDEENEENEENDEIIHQYIFADNHSDEEGEIVLNSLPTKITDPFDERIKFNTTKPDDRDDQAYNIKIYAPQSHKIIAKHISSKPTGTNTNSVRVNRDISKIVDSYFGGKKRKTKTRKTKTRKTKTRK